MEVDIDKESISLLRYCIKHKTVYIQSAARAFGGTENLYELMRILQRKDFIVFYTFVDDKGKEYKWTVDVEIKGKVLIEWLDENNRERQGSKREHTIDRILAIVAIVISIFALIKQ